MIRVVPADLHEEAHRLAARRARRRNRLGCLMSGLLLVSVVVGVLYLGYSKPSKGPRVDSQALAAARAFTTAMFIHHDCAAAEQWASESSTGSIHLCTAAYQPWQGIVDVAVDHPGIVRKCQFVTSVLQSSLIDVVPSPDCITYDYKRGYYDGTLMYVMTKASGHWKVAYWQGAG